MTKTVGLVVLTLALGIATVAMAGTRVQLKDSQSDAQEAARKARYDHPFTRVIPSHDVKVEIKTDSIMHSCCMPPNLVVAGRVTNISAHPLNYVKMIFSFEDADGKVVHAETVYNSKAASLGDDEEVSRLLNEKPHFEPLAPGATDDFSFSIPTPVLPRFAKVELYSDAITR